MAELLGYGAEDDFEQLYSQLDKFEDEIEDGQTSRGFFQKFEKSMASLMD